MKNLLESSRGSELVERRKMVGLYWGKFWRKAGVRTSGVYIKVATLGLYIHQLSKWGASIFKPKACKTSVILRDVPLIDGRSYIYYALGRRCLGKGRPLARGIPMPYNYPCLHNLIHLALAKDSPC